MSAAPEVLQRYRAMVAEKAAAPAGWPFVPTVSLLEARASDDARLRLDLENALAAGLSEAELGPYLAALARFDEGTPAWEAYLAAERAQADLERTKALVEERRAVLGVLAAWGSA